MTEKYYARMRNAAGKEIWAQGWKLDVLKQWIADNELDGFTVVETNFAEEVEHETQD